LASWVLRPGRERKEGNRGNQKEKQKGSGGGGEALGGLGKWAGQGKSWGGGGIERGKVQGKGGPAGWGSGRGSVKREFDQRERAHFSSEWRWGGWHMSFRMGFLGARRAKKSGGRKGEGGLHVEG